MPEILKPNSREDLNILKSYEEIILEYDKKIAEEQEYIRKIVLINQKNRFVELKKRFEELMKTWVTKETQYALNILNRDIVEKVKNVALLWEDIDKAAKILMTWKRNLEDNLIDRSFRDYIEKNIKFSSDKFLKIKETWFESAFYDQFTLNYLDFFYEKWYSTDKKDIFKDKKFFINKEEIEEVLSKTVFDLTKSWWEIDENISVKLRLANGKDFEKKLSLVFREHIFEMYNKSFDKIKEDLNNLWDEFDLDYTKEILEDVNDIEKYNNMLSSRYRNFYALLDHKALQTIKLKLRIKLNNLIKNKLNEIKEEIKKTGNSSETNQNTDKLKKEYEKIKIFLEESEKTYWTKNLAEILWENNSGLYEKDFKEIYDLLQIASFNQDIKIINDLIEKIWAKNIKKSKDDMLGKIESLEKNIFDAIEKNTINAELGKSIIEDLKRNLYDKILQIYLEKAWIKEVTWRENIWSIELFKVLINAKKSWEINIDEINIILKLWYEKAFLKEFELPYIKKRVELLKSKSILDSWKDIFWRELWPIIWREKARDFFLLAYIESIFDPEQVSSAKAVWYFQIIPETGKGFGMEKEDDLKDPIKSAEIAAKYLRILLLKHLSKDINSTIRKALTEYNWWFWKRLKDKTNTKGTILEIWERLLECKANINKEGKTVKELISELKGIHSEYYIEKDTKKESDTKKEDKLDTKKEDKSDTNFFILDNYHKNPSAITKEDISKWIDWYITDILKQQYLYPEQFDAVKKAYEKYTNPN